MSVFLLKKLTFFSCRSKIISTFAPLKTKKNKEKIMNQTFNIINLLSIIILLSNIVGSECYALC